MSRRTFSKSNLKPPYSVFNCIPFNAFKSFLPKKYITISEITAKMNNIIILPVITIPYYVL